MKVELLTLSDFAADYAGKLTVVGVFDTIYARQLPAVHPHCCVAAKLRFDADEEGQRQLRLTVADDDGKLILPPMEIPIQVKVPAGALTQTIQVVANISGLKIEAFGEYSVDLALDERHEASIPLFANKMN